MGIFRIEKGIPIPERNAEAKFGFTEIAKSMAVGDSVAIDSYYHAKLLMKALLENGKDGLTKKVDENGYRVWCVQNNPKRKKQNAQKTFKQIGKPQAVPKNQRKS